MKRYSGFTVVEVLLIISVLAILAAIGMVAWGGIITSSNDRAREKDINQWAATFELYRGRYGIWPAMPSDDGAGGTASVCLGSFASSSNKCGQYTSGTAGQFIDASASPTSDMLENAAKTGSTPVNGSASIKSGSRGVIGPYVRLSQTTVSGTVTVTAYFVGFFQGNCPSGFTLDSSNAPSSTMLTSVSGAKACALQKTFAYTPS